MGCCLWLAIKIAATKLGKPVWLEPKAQNIMRQVHVDKTYNETHFLKVVWFLQK